MCGIIGYVGRSQALPVLVQGIRLLSYRGYDSAGVAVHDGTTLRIEKDRGRISDLAPRWDPATLAGSTGIGHTRWATHGAPNRVNAHPQSDAANVVAVVHNGILENDLALREELEKAGVTFRSDTDTEVFAHLFARDGGKDPVAAARELLDRCHGHFALAFVHADHPERIVAVRRGSPLLLGLGVRENLVASDLRALAGRADAVVELGDDQIAIVEADDVRVLDKSGSEVEVVRRPVEEHERETDKAGFAHFMAKEIHEQPERQYELVHGRMDTVRGHARFDDLPLQAADWKRIERVDLVACGTAYHACLYGAYALERLARIPARALMAHEYDARQPRLDDRTLVIAVSQSGETADTKVAVELALREKARTLAVLNVPHSAIGRLVEGVVDMHAGPEVGVASTKAYTGMLTSLLLLALAAAEARGTTNDEARELIAALDAVPDAIRRTLARTEGVVADVVREIYRAGNMLYLGRGPDAATALEGALKMKEISYIHAEGYPAGEMKHGPIALVSFDMPTVAIATAGPWRDRMLGNVREVKARDGLVVLLAAEGDVDAPKVADFVLPVPSLPPLLAPIVNVVPLQVLAYETAKRRGCDIDQPRNLAKTVTVQ